MRATGVGLLVLLVICFVSVQAQRTYIQIGSDVNVKVAERVVSLLSKASPYPIVSIDANTNITYSTLQQNSLVFSMGDTTQANLMINKQDLAALGEEGYIIISDNYASLNITTFATQGNALNNLHPFVTYNNIGLHFGIYQMLKNVGFGFLHPLQPLVPSTLRIPSQTFNITESPAWSIRTWHYHTEHPLELTEFLNGMDSENTTWAEMITEFESVAEWLVANRQNRFEWLLLWTSDHNEEAFSSTRQSRQKTICDILHAFGIAAGADVPIAEKQQHAWYMTGQRYTDEEQRKNISDHIDWLMVPGFDFISTESGYSEFTHPNCTLMLNWMNYATQYLLDNYSGKRIYIKCHCSSGQVCPEYLDPYTNEPINFNFLPAFATPDLGVYPHTVQMYDLFQPAPTYGNMNFTYMLEFLVQEAGTREVVFHGETAYWVNYDIDVPLFLSPLYGASRIADMRYVANATAAANRKAQGQTNFCSGWEWAYWLGDIMTATAVWDPMLDIATNDAAVTKALTDLLSPMASSSVVNSLVYNLQQIIEIERQLLIFGLWDGVGSDAEVVRKNGQAYIQGWDTWSEWSSIVKPSDSTQPAKLTFHDVRRSPSNSTLPDYEQDIQPLLETLQSNYSTLLTTFVQLRNSVYPEALPFFDELTDTLNITYLRAQEVYYLYQYVWGALHKTPSWRKQQIEIVNAGLVQIQNVVARREAQYRVPVSRIAGWRANPTAYHYGYLWTVHSMYYFWRDYSQATNHSISTITPCFMNIITPIDIAFGHGRLLNLSIAFGEWLNAKGLNILGECMSAPAEEPVYPQTPIIDTNNETKFLEHLSIEGETESNIDEFRKLYLEFKASYDLQESGQTLL